MCDPNNDKQPREEFILGEAHESISQWAHKNGIIFDNGNHGLYISRRISLDSLVQLLLQFEKSINKEEVKT